MIPLKDTSRSPQQFPYVTILIITINFIVFFCELANGDAFINRWSATPAVIVGGHHWITLLTSMFMHAGWLHILGNMLFFWVFAPAIEDAMGSWRFLAFYLIGGLIAAFAEIAISPTSTIPFLGASGAIAAVMGAFLVTYPQDEIRTIVPLGFIATITPVRAVILVGLWFVLQAISAIGMKGHAQQGGTAYMAHVGGFLFGALFGRLFEGSGRAANQALPDLNS